VTEFTTMDSGKHEQYDSGMRRDSQDGKPRFDLIRTKLQPYGDQMITRYAGLLARGAAKYSERNWEDGDSEVELERAKASLLRHVEQLVAGETDEDHAAAVWFNAQAVEYFRWRIEQKKAAQADEVSRRLEFRRNHLVREAFDQVFPPVPQPVETSEFDAARKSAQDLINAWHNRPEYATVLPSPEKTAVRPDDDLIIDVDDAGKPVRRRDLLGNERSGAQGLYQFMDGPWSTQEPGDAPTIVERFQTPVGLTDVDKIRRRVYLDAMKIEPREIPTLPTKRVDEWLQEYGIELMQGDLGTAYEQINLVEFEARLRYGAKVIRKSPVDDDLSFD
jgi:hypothetical protein